MTSMGPSHPYFSSILCSLGLSHIQPAHRGVRASRCLRFVHLLRKSEWRHSSCYLVAFSCAGGMERYKAPFGVGHSLGAVAALGNEVPGQSRSPQAFCLATGPQLLLAPGLLWCRMVPSTLHQGARALSAHGVCQQHAAEHLRGRWSTRET